MTRTFVPSDFIVPRLITKDKYIFRMIRVKDAKLDSDAIMSSIEHIHKTPTPPMCGDWPQHTLTLEQDKIDLKWHEEKHNLREVFTYTIMNPTETKCLGCIYIYPSTHEGFDAESYFYVTEEQFNKGLDSEIYIFLKKWLNEKWPFQNVIFPKRNPDGTY